MSLFGLKIFVLRINRKRGLGAPDRYVLSGLGSALKPELGNIWSL